MWALMYLKHVCGQSCPFFFFFFDCFSAWSQVSCFPLISFQSSWRNHGLFQLHVTTTWGGGHEERCGEQNRKCHQGLVAHSKGECPQGIYSIWTCVYVSITPLIRCGKRRMIQALRKLTMSEMNPFKYISVETGSEEGGIQLWLLPRWR